MNRSKLWGFEVGQIVTSFGVLAACNVALNIMGGPLIVSWAAGFACLLTLRIVSMGQKDGHLELWLRYVIEPHLYLGHRDRRKGTK